MSFSEDFSEKSFETIFYTNRDGIAIIDDEGNFLKFNPVYMRMTGYSHDDLLKKNFFLLTHPKDQKLNKIAIKKVISQGYVDSFEKKYLNKQGNLVSVHEAFTLLPGEKWILVSSKDLTETEQLVETVHNLEQFDSLTHLHNRNQFTLHFNQLIKSIEDTHSIYLGYVDLDNFKRINDHFGHQAGDELLIAIARRIKHDLQKGEIVSRFGGDEFTLLLIAESQNKIKQRLQAIVNRIEQPYILEATPIPMEVSCSIGITQYSEEFNELDTLLRQADQAMCLAKQPNQAAIKYFSQQDFLKTISRQKQLVEISNAIQHDEMILHYQPFVNLRTGEITGLESLVRWVHPENGIIYPDHFLPIIESTSVIIEMDRWVIRQVLKEANERFKSGYHWPISINISNRMFHHEEFIDYLSSQLQKYPSLPEQILEIEVLESVAISDFAHAKQVINAGKQLGVKFSLDDFGTGYSSISYLKNLPFDTVKIDKMFIQTMLSHPKEMEIVEATIDLAKVFNLKVIAEGVETIEHGIVLLRYNCNLAQGFGIAVPMDNDKVIPWAKEFIPDPSWALWADALWESKDFPLLVAKSDHIVWVEQVLVTMKEPNMEPDFKHLKDEYSCRFGNWYYGVGKQHYQDLPSYKQIEPVHSQVHQLGNQMYQLKDAGDLESATKLIGDLLKCRDHILRCLDQLHREFISQNKQ